MSFTLHRDDLVVTWDAGQVSGAPFSAVSEAKVTLATALDAAGSTPTGPFFAAGTPEHAYLTLRRLWPNSESLGEVPAIETQPDELDEPEPGQLREGYEERKHMRGRGGRWVRMQHPGEAKGDPGDGDQLDLARADEFKAVFDGFEHGGLRAVVDHAVQDNPPDHQPGWLSVKLASVEGHVEDVDGHMVGGFERDIFRDPEVGLIVKHVSFRMGPHFRQLGYGDAFVQHSFDAYRAAGVARVRVDTAEVGGYLWAKSGFDFDTGLYGVMVTGTGPYGDAVTDPRFVGAYASKRLWENRREDFLRERERGDVPAGEWEEFVGKFATVEQLEAYAAGDGHALDGKFQSSVEIAMHGRNGHTWEHPPDPIYKGRMWLGKRFMLGALWAGERRP